MGSLRELQQRARSLAQEADKQLAAAAEAPTGDDLNAALVKELLKQMSAESAD